MTANQINRAVSQATGDSVREIRRHGFQLAISIDSDYDPESDDIPPQVIDWDQVDLQRFHGE
jgi:hypothetical protein